jgi:hypothetical protein
MTFLKSTFNFTVLPFILIVLSLMLLPVLLLTDDIRAFQYLMDRMLENITD